MASSNLIGEEGDPLFPGEGWFCYWKTSSSLWKSKLEEHQCSSPLLIPINWAFHTETGEKYDFGQMRPEADLAKLAELGRHLCKKMVFLFPLTSLPFLPNGGLPPFLSRNVSYGPNQLAYGIVDSTGNIFKFYSFFDPRVYQAYRKFVWEFSQFVGSIELPIDVIGLTCGYVKDKRFISYIHDYSNIFEQGFSRFLEMKNKEESEEMSLRGEKFFPTGNEESRKNEFTRMIRDLYFSSAKECLGIHWGGEIRVAFLGGGAEDIFKRSSESGEFAGQYFGPLMNILALDCMPSSILLPIQVKRGALKKFLTDLINNSYFLFKSELELYDDDYGMNYMPLKFFEVYQNPHHLGEECGQWERLGIFEYFDRDYKGTYHLPSTLSHLSAQDFVSERILFISSHDLQESEFKTLLKVFLNGGRIILDRTGLKEELRRKLDLFLLENALVSQKINYITEIVTVTLGEGILLSFDGSKLQEIPLLKKLSFWENLMGLMRLDHIKVQEDNGLFYYWRFRSPRPNEISFTEIRRISLFNPTSYRKKVKILNRQNFELLKLSDQINVEVHTNSLGIDVELYPEGSVSIDYGYND